MRVHREQRDLHLVRVSGRLMQIDLLPSSSPSVRGCLARRRLTLGPMSRAGSALNDC